MPDDVERVEAAFHSATLSAAIGESDVVVHAAGLTRALDPSAFEFNVSGTRAVVGAVNATGARLILISSQAAMGAGTIRPSDARRRCAQAADSVRSKQAGRGGCGAIRCPRSGPSSAPTIVYGPRDRQFLPIFRLAARGIFLQVAPAATAFTLIYVDDLARGVVLAAEAGGSGLTVFLGHPDPARADGLLGASGRRVWTSIPTMASAWRRVAGRRVGWPAGVEIRGRAG